MIKIINEKPHHMDEIYNINATAFETDAEAKLVNKLRNSCPQIISLVAEEEGKAVGHILFSPVSVKGADTSKLMGLAPMAVAPSFQNKGIGSLLVREGVAACKKAGYYGIVVLEHPDYYPRFGFEPSVKWGFKSEYEVPDEVFMAMETKEGGLSGLNGSVIVFHPAFKDV